MTRVLRGQVRHPALDGDRRIRPRSCPTPTPSSCIAPTCSAWRSSISCAVASAARRRARTPTSRRRPAKKLTEGAEKRLKVLQSLDTLGAGFSLASHDLDIRGAGNLLGRGAVGPHPRGRLRALSVDAGGGGRGDEGRRNRGREDKWSPDEFSSARRCMIPETYVTDLQLRLGLYRRLSTLEKRAEIDASPPSWSTASAQMPNEVEHLLDVMEIKGLCRAGRDREGRRRAEGRRRRASTRTPSQIPKGSSPFVQNARGRVKVQPDQKIVFKSRVGSAGRALEGRARLHHRAGRHRAEDQEGRVSLRKRAGPRVQPRSRL